MIFYLGIEYTMLAQNQSHALNAPSVMFVYNIGQQQQQQPVMAPSLYGAKAKAKYEAKYTANYNPYEAKYTANYNPYVHYMAGAGEEKALSSDSYALNSDTYGEIRNGSFRV